MILWRMFHNILMLSMQTLMTIFLCQSPKYWCFLVLGRWFFDDFLKGYIWNIDIFDGYFFDLYCFWCVNLWIIHVSLLLQWWFVDDSLKKHWWHYEGLDANGRDHWGLYCDNHKSADVPLLLHWLIVDDLCRIFDKI